MPSRSFPVKPLSGLLLALFLVLLLGCTPSHPQSTFETAGPVAKMQLDLFIIIFWAAVGVFIVVEGILLYAVIRFRRRPGQGIPKQVHGNTPLEIFWTILPAIVLAVIAVPTINTIYDTAKPPTDDAFEVTVVGHQWWWEFKYPELNVVTANELRIPVGEPIALTLESEDVIHSFWVPKLAGKTDVVPNNLNTMWFQADEPGTYLGQCAEFCGIAHALMRLSVVAMPKDDFDAWVNDYKQATSQEFTDLAAEGAGLFTTKGCNACHTSDGPPLFEQIGPNLTLFGLRTTIGDGKAENNPQNQTTWLHNPNDIKPGNRMFELAPYYQSTKAALTDEEIKALSAYLSSLK